MTHAGGRRSRALVVAVTATMAAVAGTLTACAGPRNSLNTDASVCFRSLAVASGAVQHKGRLVGVRRVSARQFTAQMPHTTARPRDPVCLVAYESDYRPGQVAAADPPGPGRYAVVAVTAGTPVLLGATVTDRLPLRFRHPA